MKARVGIGVDAHPLREGRPLVLGGVRLDHRRGLAGHSDADVLAHAIGDALLGAAGQGDLGQLFPPGDPRYSGACSLDLLGEVCRRIRREGWRIEYIDAVLIAQEPRVAPAIPEMRRRLARAMVIEPARVHVKATSPEGMGHLGRGEGIEARAVALLGPGGEKDHG